MVGFLDMPLEVRKAIYGMIYTMRRPLFVGWERMVDGRKMMKLVERPSCWLGLLFSNRQTYVEAGVVLYATNRFYMVESTGSHRDLKNCDGCDLGDSVQRGLFELVSRIGTRNAAVVSHICVNFPDVVREAGRRTVLMRGNLLVLRSKLVNLSTLEFFAWWSNMSCLVRNETIFREVVSVVDAELQTMSRLRRTVIRDEGDAIPPWAREVMTGCGWEVAEGREAGDLEH